jgi:hypothetical protein
MKMRDDERLPGKASAPSITAVALILTACGSGTRNNPSQLQDTTGLKIDWSCDDTGCLPPAEPAFQTCDRSTGYTVVLDKLFFICASTIAPDGSSFWFPEDCRATACSSDRDCPLFQGHLRVQQ